MSCIIWGLQLFYVIVGSAQCPNQIGILGQGCNCILVNSMIGCTRSKENAEYIHMLLQFHCELSLSYPVIRCVAPV